MPVRHPKSNKKSSTFNILHWFLGVNVVTSGDKLQRSDKIRLIISNHPTSLDWLWLWFLQHQQCSTSTIVYFKKVKSRVTLVLYPEGGTLYEGSVQKSKKFAEKNGKQSLERLLLPREKGFSEIIKHAEVDTIYDVTLAMPEMEDGKLAYDMGIDKLVMKGIYPKTVHLHVKRYS